MKKALNSIVLGVFLLGTLFIALPGSSAQAALGEASFDTLQKKRCEKCERGDDGKMVCKPVPCP